MNFSEVLEKQMVTEAEGGGEVGWVETLRVSSCILAEGFFFWGRGKRVGDTRL